MLGQDSFREKLGSPVVTQGGERKAASTVFCPSCGSGALRRNAREGFLENRVLNLFGYYPWECADCRKKTYLRLRYKPGRKDRKYSK